MRAIGEVNVLRIQSLNAIVNCLECLRFVAEWRSNVLPWPESRDALNYGFIMIGDSLRYVIVRGVLPFGVRRI